MDRASSEQPRNLSRKTIAAGGSEVAAFVTGVLASVQLSLRANQGARVRALA